METSLNQLEHFILQLSTSQNTNQKNNFYKDVKLLQNLRLYLKYLIENKPNYALIGEAPGYRGCAQTGIPFSSKSILTSSDNDFFNLKRKELNINGGASESTATIIWKCIGNKNVPLLWNIYPFHPHKENNLESNRKPKALEIKDGIELCVSLIDIIKPKVVIAVGRVSESALEKHLDKNAFFFEAVRHPSYGGSTKFGSMMLRLKDKYNLE